MPKNSKEYSRGKNPNSRNGFKKGHPKYFFGHSRKSRGKIKEAHERIGSPWNIGRKHTEDAKRKMSEARKGKPAPWVSERNLKNNPTKRGPEHWKWIEDRTKLAKRQKRNDMAYKEWRKEVYRRDNWKCRINDCDCEGRIVAHHILPWKDFPELRYKVNNGITLCQAQKVL